MKATALEIKTLLEKIERRDSAIYDGKFYLQIREAIDIAIVGKKLAAPIDKAFDFLPAYKLTQYCALCAVLADSICVKHLEPIEAISLINFLGDVGNSMLRISGMQKD